MANVLKDEPNKSKPSFSLINSGDIDMSLLMESKDVFPQRISLERLCLKGTCCCCLFDLSLNDSADIDDPSLPKIRHLPKQKLITLIGLINCCSHSFHLHCILSWSHRENSCPQCKRRFTCLFGYSRVDGTREFSWRIRHMDQKFIPELPSTTSRTRRSRDSPPSAHIFCFICLLYEVNESTDSSTTLWLHCSGNHGTCVTACHKRCFDELAAPLSLSSEFESLWFCPYCIVENRCINSRRQRIIDCSPFLSSVQIPSISALSSISFSSRPDVVQPFLHFYKSMNNQINRTLRKRKRPPAIESPTVHQHTKLRHRCLEHKVSVTHSMRQRSFAMTSILGKTFLENEEDNEYETNSPPPFREFFQDFHAYELFERTYLGHKDYGKSIYSSRSSDGGILSGRDFIASLFCLPHSVQNNSGGSSDSVLSSTHEEQVLLGGTVLSSDSIESKETHEEKCSKTSRSVESIHRENISCGSEAAQRASSNSLTHHNLKPSSSLVSLVKRYLKPLTQERELFKIVCRSVSESLVREHEDILRILQDAAAITFYWSSKEDVIRNEVIRQWTLYSS